jgi:hypothetical protein
VEGQNLNMADLASALPPKSEWEGAKWLAGQFGACALLPNGRDAVKFIPKKGGVNSQIEAELKVYKLIRDLLQTCGSIYFPEFKGEHQLDGAAFKELTGRVAYCGDKMYKQFGAAKNRKDKEEENQLISEVMVFLSFYASGMQNQGFRYCPN